MVQQIVVITPDTAETVESVLGFIRSTLPDAVTDYLASCQIAGTRTTSVVVDDNTFTVTTQWDDSAVEEYKTLMASVSGPSATTVADAGWTMEFTPLTTDL